MHDLHPRVMVAREHREDNEGECFVLVWALRWPYSFRYNCQGKVVQEKREFRHSDLTTVRLQKLDWWVKCTPLRRVQKPIRIVRIHGYG
jgi:hypothetical protein